MGRERPRRALGLIGLAGLGASAAGLAAPGPELVPAASGDGPAWLLGLYGDGLGLSPAAYYGLLWLAFGSYLCVAAAAPALGARTVVAAAVILVTAFALAPPLLSQDVFSYIAYARMEVEHGLDPYDHPPLEIAADPVFPHVGWTESASAYGPLFTLLSLPLALISVPAALWALKAVAAAAVLALAALVARLAPARGLDGRRALVLVALNPLVLVHVVGGAHNDSVAMLLTVAGVAAVLSLRERTAGAALVAAAAVKLSAAVVAPFALLASRPRSALGAAAALVAIGTAGLLAFGPAMLESAQLAGENQGRVSNYSLPNLISEAAGLDVGVVRALAAAAYLALFGALLVWTARGGDWLRAAGWAVLGLLLATAWLLPWYMIWLLPLAALSRDGRLLAAAMALTALLLAARVPL